MVKENFFSNLRNCSSATYCNDIYIYKPNRMLVKQLVEVLSQQENLNVNAQETLNVQLKKVSRERFQR